MLGWTDLKDYDFRVVTLLEPIQIEWMYQWKNHEHIGLLMNAYPTVAYFIKHKLPHMKNAFERLETTYNQLPDDQTLKAIEDKFVNSLEDWIIYVTNPDIYDRLSFNQWEDKELLDLTDFKGKTVLDVGSGTGSQLFRMAPLAETIFSVEPIQNLRIYLKNKAKDKGYDHIHVVDGLLMDIPFANETFDISVAGHVFGDHPEEELTEMRRVTKTGGMMILMPGNNDVDNDTHQYLIKKGFQWDRFLEPGPDPSSGWKRKYWKIKR